MGVRIRGLAVIVVVLVTGAVLGTWIAQWAQPGGVGVEAVRIQIPTVFGERVRVEVRNGGGLDGMARAATDLLRDAGFDVVEVGNWETFDVDSSFVMVRTEDLEPGRRAADILGISDVRSEPATNLYVDVSVVLGSDWSPERVRSTPDGNARRPWWDLRQYFERPEALPPEGARLVDPEQEEGNR